MEQLILLVNFLNNQILWRFKIASLPKILQLLVTLTIICGFSAGCSTGRIHPPDAYIKSHNITRSAYSNFQLCYAHGCSKKVDVQLNDQEWEIIKEMFSANAETGTAERETIAKVVQQLEKMTGDKTGINTDRGGSFPGLFKANQMDCIDETVNTNIFLLQLQMDGLLEHHRFYGITSRGFLVKGWPHFASTIEEISTQELFVVDSWFSDHGGRVYIVPEKNWKQGWNPED